MGRERFREIREQADRDTREREERFRRLKREGRFIRGEREEEPLVLSEERDEA